MGAVRDTYIFNNGLLADVVEFYYRSARVRNVTILKHFSKEALRIEQTPDRFSRLL